MVSDDVVMMSAGPRAAISSSAIMATTSATPSSRQRFFITSPSKVHVAGRHFEPHLLVGYPFDGGCGRAADPEQRARRTGHRRECHLHADARRDLPGAT